MADILLKYFDKRLDKSKTREQTKTGFITISRQTGCNGNSIAAKLASELSKKQKWKFINKEILESSASKLNIKDSKVRHLFSADNLSHANEIISAFSQRYYKSDRKLKNTIVEVIRNFAEDGNIIIVGRAAVGITANMQNGLHIRLEAPHEWRLNSLKERKVFERLDIEKFIAEHDKKKASMIKRFCNKNINDIPFHLSINCAHFTQEQIVRIIYMAAAMKGII